MLRPEVDAELSPFLTPNDRLIHPGCKAKSYKQFLKYMSKDKVFGDNFIQGAASKLFKVNFIVFPSEGVAIEIKYSQDPSSPVYTLALDLDRLHYTVVDWNKVVGPVVTKVGRVVKGPPPLSMDLQVRTSKLPEVVRSKHMASCKRYRERKKAAATEKKQTALL